MLRELMLDVKWSAISMRYLALWRFSCALKHPVFEWGWKGHMLKKKTRDALWEAYQRDINRTE